MEVYQSLKIHCDVGQVDTTLNVAGGELVDNAQAYVEHICPGCKRWNQAKVERMEAEVEEEWPGSVNYGRVPTMEQHLVDLARFKGGESKIVVATCTFLAAGSGESE